MFALNFSGKEFNMLSDVQRLSKGLIIYSALIADFEKLDFKNDALAGVRANYFNSNHYPQSDKTDVEVDNRSYSLSYTMREGEALLWKVTSNNSPYQKVKRVSDEVYCVLTYSGNGVVNKRLYYDNFHNWLASEYYDNLRDNALLATIKPVTIDGVICVKYDKISPGGEKTTEYFYPSDNPKNQKCACIIYSNCGMIRYDSTFKPADMETLDNKDDVDKGFIFTVDDFTKPAVKPLDLENAEYLTAADYSQEEIKEEENNSSNGEYSAYDKIQSILYEAHKTNKNIFGEVASYSTAGDEQTAQESEQENIAAQKPETANEPEKTSEKVIEEKTEEMPEDKVEEKTEEKPEQKPGFEVREEPKPDMTKQTENGDYSYYGSLDETGQRTGKGRMVSPDGITVYEGSYSDDKRDGFGVSYYKDGNPNYVGGWQNGNRNGSGVGFRRSDGTMHAGKWTENTPDGIGARFDSDGSFFDVCPYSMGTREGKAISYDDNGNVVITVYIAGEVVAEKVITDEDIFPKHE